MRRPRGGAVAAAVVDEQQLEVLGLLFEHVTQALVEDGRFSASFRKGTTTTTVIADDDTPCRSDTAGASILRDERRPARNAAPRAARVATDARGRGRPGARAARVWSGFALARPGPEFRPAFVPPLQRLRVHLRAARPGRRGGRLAHLHQPRDGRARLPGHGHAAAARVRLPAGRGARTECRAGVPAVGRGVVGLAARASPGCARLARDGTGAERRLAARDHDGQQRGVDSGARCAARARLAAIRRALASRGRLEQQPAAAGGCGVRSSDRPSTDGRGGSRRRRRCRTLLGATRRAFRGQLRALATLFVGGLLGFMAANGAWALRLWERFGNPIFPLANQLFRSPYFEPVFSRDYRFVARDPWDYLRPPLDIALGRMDRFQEIGARAAATCCSRSRSSRSPPSRGPQAPLERALLDARRRARRARVLARGLSRVGDGVLLLPLHDDARARRPACARGRGASARRPVRAVVPAVLVARPVSRCVVTDRILGTWRAGRTTGSAWSFRRSPTGRTPWC